MRLDLFLKQTALIKRRTIAKELVERGKILANGKEVKPAYEVKEGDLLTLILGNRKIVAKASFVTNGKRIVPSVEQISVEKIC